MADRKAKTMQLSGNDYSKVAERMKLFRSDFSNSKTETDHVYLENGTVEFKAWLWKDKSEYIDLVKSGVTDRDVLRSTADADGDSRSEVGVKQKDFEKLQTIAVGRALGNLGYLASGDIASFEEMQEFDQYKKDQLKERIDEAVTLIESAKNNDELNAAVKTVSDVLMYDEIINAGKARRAELAKAATSEDN